MSHDKFNLKIILVIILLLLVICENILRLRKGMPPLEPQPDDFYSNYIEIHQKFFKKLRVDKGEIICKAQRSKSPPVTFFLNKKKGVKRIFVVGGSVAMMFIGDTVLRDLLGGLFNGLEFEIICCGMAGYDSYRESLILNEIITYSPDLIIVMSGNNEFFSLAHVNLFAYKWNNLLRKLWIYRLLQDKFVKQNQDLQINPEDRTSIFERTLNRMTHRAKNKNVPVALCTLPVNFRDCSPNGRPSLEERAYFQAWYSFTEGDFEQAAQRFKQFLTIHSQDTFGNYFLARCYDKLGDYSQAKDYYLKALTLDVDPGDRCTPQRNAVIRKLCGKQDLILIDLEKTFMDVSPHQLVGNELFVDNCHWWSESYQLVYQTIIQSILKYNRTHPKPVFASPVSQDTEKYYLNQETSLRPEFFLPQETRENMEERAFRRLMYGCSKLLSYDTNTINERAIAYLTVALELNQDLFKDKDLLRKKMYQKFSENPWLEEHLSDFNNVWPVFLYHAGETYRRLGLYDQAIEYLNDAIDTCKSDFWLPFLIRGMAYYKIRKIKEAKEDFYKAEEMSMNCFYVRFCKEAMGL